MEITSFQNLQDDIDTKHEKIKETLSLAHGYLLQQDMRPSIYSHMEQDEEDEGTLRSKNRLWLKFFKKSKFFKS